MNRIIKTAEEYESALARLHHLLDGDPKPASDTASEIELRNSSLNASLRRRL
jgi:antitoxin component HigA of HigAB toxin-antitoxin module